MNLRIAAASLLPIVWVVSGCSNIASPPPTTHPASMQPDATAALPPPESDPVVAKALEEDLKLLVQSRDEGLIRDEDYTKAVTLKVQAIAATYTPANGSWQSISTERLHAELAYLSQMTSRKILSAAQFDDARDRLVTAFGAANGMPTPIFGGGAGKADPVKNLEQELLALQASHAKGVLNDKEFQQAHYRCLSSFQPQATGLEELNDAVARLSSLQKRGMLTAEQFETFRTATVRCFVPGDAPTSQPAGQPR